MPRIIFSLIFVLILITSCSEPSTTPEKPMPDSPGKVLNVGFVVVEGVFNSELVAPMDIFHHTVFHTEPAMKVFTVAPDSGLITTFEGLRFLPDYTMDSPDLPPIDILVVPSAEHNMDSDLQNETLISFVKQRGQKARYVLSLCDGAFILAKAGLVDDHISTTFPSDITTYRQQFPHLEVRENVSFVHDKNLITSAGGAKSYDPALYLCELLYGHEVALGLARGLVIDWDLSGINYEVID